MRTRLAIAALCALLDPTAFAVTGHATAEPAVWSPTAREWLARRGDDGDGDGDGDGNGDGARGRALLTPDDDADPAAAAVPERNASVRADAVALVRDGRGDLGASILLRHMRKAGGTTLKGYFERVVQAKHTPLELCQSSVCTLIAADDVANHGRRSKTPSSRNKKQQQRAKEKEKAAAAALSPTMNGTAVNKTEAEAASRRMAIKVTAQEWGVFPVACLASAPRTLFVTCLREPVSRHISEYW